MYRHMDRGARVSTKRGKRRQKKRGERVDREVRMETEMVERLKRSFQRVVRDIRTIDTEYTLPAASVIRIPICISHAIKCDA